ncbi:hypothetical protein [uncultured Arcticibacterium sp.]|uniref:hypothetical protein n=1 Tax=uncultured Arcticibacterium sp. TaxID=2173042 RepID=UPI0030F94A9E
MKLSFWKLLFFLLPVLSLQAQDFPLTPFQSSDWVKPWKEAQNLSIHPFEDKIDITNGKGVLYSLGSGSMTSKKKFSSFKLEFEFLQSQSTDATLIIQNALVISLGNGSGEQMGTIKSGLGDLKPSQNVSKETGLWQKVELVYNSHDTNSGLLERLVINGVTVSENYFLNDAKAMESPLSINLVKGTMAIRNMAYTTLKSKSPISVSNLKYKIEDSQNSNNSSALSGTSETMTFNVPHDFKRFVITYTGTLKVSEKDLYAFTVDYQGKGKFKIDGEEVAGSDNIVFRIPETKVIELEAGNHSFEYEYERVWWSPGFGLFVSGVDFKPYPLHDAKNLPVNKPVGGIYLHTDAAKAKTVRSFVNFDGKKRTKAISVGTPQKRHYSLDLENGSLLYVWKGDFADVTEMWYQRGEPQILQALGQSVKLSGKPSFFQKENDDFKLEEYFLDNKGIPTYLFSLNGSAVSQKLEPVKNGMEVSLSADKKDIKYLLAEARTIEKLSDTLFRTDEYYIELSSATAVKIEQKGEVQRLIGSAQEIESYTLIW